MSVIKVCTAAASPGDFGQPENGDGSLGLNEPKDTETGKRSGHADPQPTPHSDEKINVGAGGKLSVPREEAVDEDDGEELDLAAMQARKIRKPGKREWIILNRESEHPAKLLIHKPDPDGMDEELYFIAEQLRGAIEDDDLKSVRIFQYFSIQAKCVSLWVVKKTIDNPWYESLNTLLKYSPEFFAANAIRVRADKKSGAYRVKTRPYTGPSIIWPSAPMGDLLGEALGPDRFITSVDHPIYHDLIDGEELR